MKRVETYSANIWLGRRKGYDGKLIPVSKIKSVCQKYVEKGLCVTVTETEFIYTGGNEEGVCIGLINYPRFPSEPHEVVKDAMELAQILMKELEQFRCTVVASDKTYLLENEELVKDEEKAEE